MSTMDKNKQTREKYDVILNGHYNFMLRVTPSHNDHFVTLFEKENREIKYPRN